MTDVPKNRRRFKLLRRLGIGVVVLGALLLAGLYFTGSRFNSLVKTTIVDLLEETGGRVELKSVHWRLSKLAFEIDDLTIHGLETPNEVPYVHVDHLIAEARIISLWSRSIGLRYLEVTRPVVHIIVYPDGSTNQPMPKRRKKSSKDPVQQLFDLEVERVDVRDGQLLINDRPVPVDFTADNLKAGISYNTAERKFDGSVEIGKIDTKFRDFRPFSATAVTKFGLFPNRLEVNSLTLTSGHSRVEATGRVLDFTRPKIEVSYKTTVDLAQFGATARVREMYNGSLQMTGTGAYSNAEFSSSGKLAIRNFGVKTRSVHIQNATFGTEFSIAKQRVQFKHLLAVIFGGVITGDAEVALKDKEAQRGSAQLKVSNVLVPNILSAVSDSSLPLDRLGLVGTTNGSVDIAWKGSLRNGLADIAVGFSPPPAPGQNELPVSGELRGTYSIAREELGISRINLAMRSTTINGNGLVGRSNADLNLAVTTTDLDELKPALSALRWPTELPLDVHGRASFVGSMGGKLSVPTFTGHVEAHNFDTVLRFPHRGVERTSKPAQPQTVRLHWDKLITELQLTSSLVALRNSVLQHGAAQVSFNSTVGLSTWKFLDSSPISIQGNARNAEISDFELLAGYNYPITGKLNLSARIEGTRERLRGNGKLRLTNVTAWGETAESVSSDLKFTGQEVQFTNLDVAQNSGRVTGLFAYNVSSEFYRFDLRGSDVNLADIKELKNGKFSAAGLLNFTAEGSGTTAEPSIDADLQFRNLILNGERAGDLNVQAVTSGPDLRINAQSNFEKASLNLAGTVRLRDQYPANISLQLSGLDIDPLLRPYMQGRLTGHTLLAGKAELRGPLRKPKELNITGSVDGLSLDMENVKVHNNGPILFSMRDQVLRLEQARLVGDNTELSAEGTLGLSESMPLDLHAVGYLNLKLLQTLNPDLMSSGKISMNLQVGGVLTRPVLRGELQVTRGGISYIDLPNGLSNINGTLVFNQDRLQVQKLTAQTGGGTLDLGGFINYGRHVTFNLTAKGKDIRMRYPPEVSSMADANLRMSGSVSSALLSGDITVTKFGLSPKFDFASYLVSSKQPPQIPNPSSPLNNVRLDVHITSTQELQVQTSLAKVTGDADLRLRGTAARPTLLGRVNVIEGEIYLNGTKYHLDRGDVTFVNPIRIEPVMDIEASTRVRDYDISLGFHGPVTKLSTTYRSDPPLNTADIIALLAFGRTHEDTALQPQASQSFTETASNAILGQALNAAVSSRVQRLFGVSRIKIDPQVGGAESNPSGARVTVEQQVANNITLTYITDLARSSQQVIQMEYNVNRNVSIVAVRDQYGVVAFDVRIRQRKR